MNKVIVSKMVKEAPRSEKESYVFINDKKELCQAIIAVNYEAIYVAAEMNEHFFDCGSFCDFIRNISNTGTEVMEYVFVLACYRKKTNDAIKEVLKSNMIPYLEGAYNLFYEKEYLANYDRQDDLEKILGNYLNRFAGPDKAMLDKLQFHKLKDDGTPKGVHEYVIVQYLINTCHMFVVNEELYVYKDGVYFIDEHGIYIKCIIQSLIYEQFITARVMDCIYNLLVSQLCLQKKFGELNKYPASWINFKNGMFDVINAKLLCHNPDYLSINQIPHKLDLSIQKDLAEHGKETIKFLESSIPSSDDRIMLYQYIGYCMTRDTGFQKFLIIKGIGGTGKSRIINLIQKIVGEKNYSNVSIQDLNQKFYPAMLHGKLLNACADISSDALNSVDVIKKVTGEDILLYEKKGKDANSFWSYAKLIFSANKIPLNLDEKSNAFYRRLLILEMNQVPSVIDRELDVKLERETGYLIWIAVSHLKMLYEEGKFRESAKSQLLVEDLYRAADTIKAFMDECTSAKPGALIKRDLLYEKYVEYCKGYGRKEHGANSFYKNLDEKGYRSKRTSSGRFYVDIDLVGDDFIKLDNDFTESPFSDKGVTGL